MKTISFCFAIKSSHAAAEPDYSGSVTTEIVGSECFKDGDFFGFHVETASVVRSDARYIVTVEFSCEIDIENAEYFVECFASFLTYHLSLNWSHAYGSPFVDVNYGEFFRDNGDGFRDHLSLNITRKFSLDHLPNSVSELHELVQFYFLGMQSNNVKAKYFNLFLILESIEKSPVAHSMYANGTLFSEAEAHAIRALASKMRRRPGSMLASVLGYTEESRHVKLSAALHQLGVATFCAHGTTATDVTPEVIKEIIGARNKLFHKGSAFDQNLLWGTLIPLTRQVISRLLLQPDALDPVVLA